VTPNGYKPTYLDEHALTRHFINVLEERLAGRHVKRKVNTHPLDWCHLGVLGPVKGGHAPVVLDSQQIEAELADVPATAPSPNAASQTTSASAATSQPKEAASTDEEPKSPTDRTEVTEGTRRPPSALGFEVLVEPVNGFIEFTVQGTFCVFTKHLPTLAEQKQEAAEGGPLAEVARRWLVEIPPVHFKLPFSGRKSYDDAGVVQAAVDKVLTNAFSEPDVERKWPGNRPKVDKPEYVKDDASFAQFLAGETHALDKDTWGIEATIDVRATPRPDGKVRIGCYICNKTPETQAGEKGRGLKDAFRTLGDAAIHATFSVGTLRPIEILPVPHDYQYDRRVWAVGHNTSVTTDLVTKSVRTCALAVYEQARIVTRDKPAARFSDLATNTFPTLARIHEAMCDWEKDWNDKVIGGNSLNLDPAALAECKRDLEGFRGEIERFCGGIAALKADDRLLLSFQAANRVFGRLARGYDSWRLFQLVFIVTQLPALALRENISGGEYPAGVKRDWSDALEWGDVLWFRTGGGKTEAYLGLSCCAILHDRLRGKNFGMTAWLRFPLRMLSIQQLQRAMRMIWETELERKSLLGAAASKSDPIRLGYFVGATTTPNSLSEEILQKYNSPESLERLRIVADCPACGRQGTVKVTADLKAIRFRHTCDKCSAELPLDISDDEVYRNLPTLVVGTIDKMASVGQQQKFGMLWGGARWRCPTHGYAFGEYCSAFGCKLDKKTRTKVTPYDPAPALHIQDELHLLQEELGAFAGHYETLIRYCETELSRRPSKVVAATATIEGFERQVQHLYGVKAARRFPGRGYDRMLSFYAEPDYAEDKTPKTARIFVAFKSASMSQADASAFCTQILHEEISRLFDNPASALALLKDAQADADVATLLNYYSTTLNYVGSLARGSRVNEALQQSAAKIRLGLAAVSRDLSVDYHSSRSTSAEVANLVHRVENPPKWDDAAFLDALVATNMISHGVDLERVNLMTMDGVPEETAEYIQASSRSGRKHVGLVVVVLAGYSLRATSIYHRFMEYHQHLDRMVSPVPVNRFAKYAAQRTLPGVALGLVYGKHAASTGNSKLNKRNEVAQLLKDLGPKFFQEAQRAYFLGQSVYDDRLERALTETLRDQLDVFEMSVRNSHEPNVRDAVRPQPMMSLRDVEAGVPFWAQADSSLLAFVLKTRE